MSTHQDHGLDEALQRLAQRAEPPEPSGVAAAGDLTRGRRRLHRRRVAAATGVVAAVLAVVGTVSAVPSMLDAARVDPAEGPSRTAEPTPRPSPTAEPTRRMITEWAVEPQRGTVELARNDSVALAPVVAAWNDVLAGHVDPDRAHLEPWTRRSGNLMYGTGEPSFQSLGGKFPWSEPGESSLAMLQLEVGGSRETLRWRCDEPYREEGTSCRALAAPDGIRALEEARDGDVVAVAAEREDGETVVVTFDPWFVNESPTPLATEPPASEALVAAATDPTFTLAGLDLSQPLGPELVAELVIEGERFLGGEGQDALAPMPGVDDVSATLRRPGLLADLRWEVQPVRDETVTLEKLCVRGDHASCLVRDEGRGEVLLAELAGTPGGFEVVHRGSTHWVRVRVEARRGDVRFLRQRALDLVVHEGWQDGG